MRELRVALTLFAAGCAGPVQSEPPRDWPCSFADGEEPDFVLEIGCERDFAVLASAPLDASIPGARSVKTVLDRIDGTLYFQNSQRYPIHSSFLEIDSDTLSPVRFDSPITIYLQLELAL